VETELLAQAVEVVSVLAADRRLKKPIQIPRPGNLAAPEAAPQTTDPGMVTAETEGTIKGHLAVAAKFAAQSRVRGSG
jgi:hypothetical protein